MVEKGRDSDRERDQGQLEGRASPEKVEKEVKKTREASHLKKFKARARMDNRETLSFCCFLG